MSKAMWVYSIVFALLLVGCGGSSAPDVFGQVTGVVTTVDGGIVSGATISTGTSTNQTTSNSDGRYVLNLPPTENTVINAKITLSGQSYVGTNVATAFTGNAAKNVNITIVPSNAVSTLDSVVDDDNGDPIENARVLVIASSANVHSSSMAVTDGDGFCRINNLMAGQQYTLTATASGYQSSSGTSTFASGTWDYNFTLGDAGTSFLGPPTNISAEAWTTPSEVTRSPNSKAAYEAIKNRLDPRRAARKPSTRSTIGGNDIEVDLYWTPIANSDPANLNNLLGYGIYRGVGSGVPTVNIDFFQDPLASFYSDLDAILVQNQTYSYQMTTRNTLYPGTSGSESAKSAPVMATTLGDMTLGSVSQGPLTFQWSSAPGATEYKVYLYDQYPALASLNPIWTSSATSGDQVVYTGSALTSGHVYYYYVIGDNGANGFTISVIDQFSAQ